MANDLRSSVDLVLLHGQLVNNDLLFTLSKSKDVKQLWFRGRVVGRIKDLILIREN